MYMHNVACRIREKEEMLVGLTLDPSKGRALGKKASQDIFR
jgi:hypothetical protein